VPKRRRKRKRHLHGRGGNHYQQGQIHFQQKDYVAAVKAWRAAMKVNAEPHLARKLAEAHFRYALSLDREHQLTGVISELHQAIQRAPHVPIYHYHLGLAYHRKGQHKRAISAYEQALKLDPDNQRFQKHLEFARVESGQETQEPYTQILRLLQQEQYAEAHEMLKTHPLGELHGLFEGFTCAMLGNYAAAKKAFNQCPVSEYVIPYYLGLIYAQEGKFSSAIKHLETAMKEPVLEEVCKQPLLGVYKQQAMNYTEAGEPGKAKQLWNKLARLDPQDAAADNAVLAALDEGYRQASEGNFTQAMRSWRRLINQGIQHPVLLQNYAIACDRVERYEDAMETWEQLAEVWEKQQRTAPDPKTMKRKLALVYRRIGEIAWNLDDIYTAEAAYQRASKHTPEDIEIRLRLVGLSLNLGDFDAAFRQLRQLRHRYPDDIRILELEVSAYLDVGDYDKVLHSCLHILKLDPKHQNALELLHTLGHDHVRELLEEDRHRQAIRFLESFIQMDATYPPFYILLGRAYLEQDKIADAEKVLVQHIELEGNKALAHAQVGKVYMSAEYFERAAVYFKEAGDLDATEPDVLLTIGIAYMPHDTDKANHYLDKLITSEPDDSEVFGKIIRGLLAEDQVNFAETIVDRGLKAYPDSVPFMIHHLAIAIFTENFNLARKIAKKARQLATKAGASEFLETISSMEMVLSIRETFGGFFGEYEEFDDEPF
jgi:tetratricopeptide (TPR) repeat protein